MICEGCGSTHAVVTRAYVREGKLHEVCNAVDCGNLTAPWIPDAYFRKPEIVEHLGDAGHPFGQMVESKRHKARIMREQGIREDGDRYHGSRDKGVTRRSFKLKPDFEKKLHMSARRAVKTMKRRP